MKSAYHTNAHNAQENNILATATRNYVAEYHDKLCSISKPETCFSSLPVPNVDRITDDFTYYYPVEDDPFTIVAQFRTPNAWHFSHYWLDKFKTKFPGFIISSSEFSLLKIQSRVPTLYAQTIIHNLSTNLNYAHRLLQEHGCSLKRDHRHRGADNAQHDNCRGGK